jgi:hypothetical protein
MRLSQTHERWVYGIGAVLFLSGLGWLIAHYFFAPASEFGETAVAPSEPWWLRVHGGAAMVFLIALGSLLPGHIKLAWKFRQNLGSGFLMLGIAGVLILTGYGLYYAGGEETRPWISLIHWAVGIAAGGGLLLHVQLGKRRSERPRPAMTRRPADVRSGVVQTHDK